MTRPGERQGQSEEASMTPGPKSHCQMDGPWLIPSSESQGLLVLKDTAPIVYILDDCPEKLQVIVRCRRKPSVFCSVLSHQPLGKPAVNLPLLKLILLHHFHLDWVDMFIYPLRDIYHSSTHDCHWVALFTFTSGTMPRHRFAYVKRVDPEGDSEAVAEPPGPAD